MDSWSPQTHSARNNASAQDEKSRSNEELAARGLGFDPAIEGPARSRLSSGATRLATVVGSTRAMHPVGLTRQSTWSRRLPCDRPG
jgi:hypothetical protein